MKFPVLKITPVVHEKFTEDLELKGYITLQQPAYALIMIHSEMQSLDDIMLNLLNILQILKMNIKIDH